MNHITELVGCTRVFAYDLFYRHNPTMESTYTIESINRADTPARLIEELDHWMAIRFKSYVWMPSAGEKDVQFILARDKASGELIGRCPIITREITVGGQPLTITAVAGIIVKDELQGQRIGDAMMKEAMKYVEHASPKFCVLMCNEELARKYARYGFECIEGGNPWFDQPGGVRAQYKPNSGVTMVYAKDDAVWPEGELDLKGLPF